MFAATDVQNRLRQQPFKPVQLVSSSGQTYNIYHPDMAIVTLRCVIVGMPSLDNPSIAGDEARVAIIHITEMRDLPERSPQLTQRSA